MTDITSEIVTDPDQSREHFELRVAFESIKEQLVNIRREIAHLSENQDKEFRRVDDAYSKEYKKVLEKQEILTNQIIDLRIKVAQGTMLAIVVSALLTYVIPALNTKIHIGDNSSTEQPR